VYNLMIVDDSRLIRKKIERECDQNLFRVVASAGNGAEALELYRKTTPDAVTMDLTMPTLDGVACIRGLVEQNSEIKILVISALKDQATGMEALEEGAMGFVTKPFSGRELQFALQEIIED